MPSFWKNVIVCALILLAFTGCNDPDAERAVAPTSAPPTSEPMVAGGDSRCQNLQEAFEGGTPLGGRLSGDVTGDGSDDEVYVVRDDEAEASCRDLLFVETEEAVLASELTDGRAYALPQPRLNSLEEIDPRAGAEIVVDLEQGASTQFVGLFTVFDDELHRVRLQPDGGPGDLFPYGGSVGHIETSDCGERDGTVVISVATPLGDRYQVQRSVYRFEEAGLVLDPAASERIEVAAEEVQDLPEYGAPPFGSCRLP